MGQCTSHHHKQQLVQVTPAHIDTSTPIHSARKSSTIHISNHHKLNVNSGRQNELRRPGSRGNLTSSIKPVVVSRQTTPTSNNRAVNSNKHNNNVTNIPTSVNNAKNYSTDNHNATLTTTTTTKSTDSLRLPGTGTHSRRYTDLNAGASKADMYHMLLAMHEKQEALIAQMQLKEQQFTQQIQSIKKQSAVDAVHSTQVNRPSDSKHTGSVKKRSDTHIHNDTHSIRNDSKPSTDIQPLIRSDTNLSLYSGSMKRDTQLLSLRRRNATQNEINTAHTHTSPQTHSTISEHNTEQSNDATANGVVHQTPRITPHSQTRYSKPIIVISPAQPSRATQNKQSIIIVNKNTLPKSTLLPTTHTDNTTIRSDNKNTHSDNTPVDPQAIQQYEQQLQHARAEYQTLLTTLQTYGITEQQLLNMRATGNNVVVIKTQHKVESQPTPPTTTNTPETRKLQTDMIRKRYEIQQIEDKLLSAKQAETLAQQAKLNAAQCTDTKQKLVLDKKAELADMISQLKAAEQRLSMRRSMQKSEAERLFSQMKQAADIVSSAQSLVTPKNTLIVDPAIKTEVHVTA